MNKCIHEACVCPHDNVKTIAGARRLYLLPLTYVDRRTISDDFRGQSEGHFSESSRSLSKVMSYSVAGSEIPFAMASFSSWPFNGHIKTVEQRTMYSNVVMGRLLHLVQRRGAWAGCGPAQSPRRCQGYSKTSKLAPIESPYPTSFSR